MTPDRARTNVGRRLEVVVALIEQEAENGRGLGVVAVAERVGREKTQISRALRSLADAGLVERDPGTLEFRAGRSLLAIAGRAGDPVLLAAAERELPRLAVAIGERVHLVVLHDRSALTVSTVAPASAVQAVGWIGRAAPLHSTASGQVLTMDLSTETLRDLLGPDPLPPGLSQAPTTLDELRARHEAIRERGVAVIDGEFEPEMTSFAAPIRYDGALQAAVGASGPSYRVAGRIDELAAAVAATGAAIAAAAPLARG